MMGLINRLRRIGSRSRAGKTASLASPAFAPHGVAPRGFHGKNAFADQVNLVGNNSTVIFDVGANTGETTQRYLELCPIATIYAFEPFPDSFEHLRTRFLHDARVRPACSAIVDADGSYSFHTFSNSVTNSLLPKARDSHQFVEGEMTDTGIITVPGVSIDQFCNQEGVDHIDILKLDIQGGELRALAGAARMLGEHRIRLLYTEVVFVPVYEGQAWFHDVAAHLHRVGYGLYDFYNFAYTETGQLKWGDAIFLPMASDRPGNLSVRA